MGFCLLEDAAMEGFFFAINSSHVEEILPQRETAGGAPSCLLKFSVMPKNFRPLVLGTRRNIQQMLMDAAKIGVQKVQSQTFTGPRMQVTPLLLNQTDRVVIVREMPHEEFSRAGIKSATASEMILTDGSIKIIAERPGVFAARANASRKVPVLDLREVD